MQAYINGEAQNLAEGTTLAALSREQGFDPARVAFEVNLAIVPRSLLEHTPIRDGDRIEIVRFIGGG